MKVHMSKHIVIIGIIIIFFLSVYHSKNIEESDLRLYSLTSFLLDKEQNISSTSVIVNIDNKSIETIKQWPWSRVIYAQLISDIDAMNPATIAFNMYFGNKDKASPAVISNFYKKYFKIYSVLNTIPKELQNNDVFLAKKLSETNTVLSIYMNEKKRETPSYCNDLAYTYLDFSSIKNIPTAQSIECNTKEFHQNNRHFGFSTINIDSDGIAREIPTLKRYKNRAIPSFGLATILSLNLHSYNSKKGELNILDNPIPLDKNSKLLLPYNTPTPKIFSAIDILKKKIPKEFFHGKIVIVGSTVKRFSNNYNIYGHKNISSNVIHALYIESLLNNSFIVQDDFYKKLNTLIACFLSILLYLFFIKRWDRAIISITIFTIVATLFYLVYAFKLGEYVSIGYLWLPLLLSYIILLISIFISRNSNEKEMLKKDLAKSFHTSATSMVLVANTHDSETGEHIIRTKKYVKLMAEELYRRGLYTHTLTPHNIELIYESAPLHDIGKVGIPDNILKKPGRFTAQEYEIMKTHSKLGADIIKKSLEYYEHNPLLEFAYNIALYHHEKWNGTGYPEQLKEDEIPIEAQLMSIADIYDALISKRRYKESFSYKKVESIIIDERGISFNPLLVDIFIEQKEKFKEISLVWNEEV